MRTFVQPRRRILPRRIVVRTESKKTSEWKLFFFYHWQKIVGIWVVGSIIYLMFFYNWNPIQRVTFSQETYTTLEYTPLLETIEKDLVGKWYYKQKFSNRSERSAGIVKQFPIVKSIHPLSFDKWTMNIDIEFHTPDLVARTQDNALWYIYHNTFVPYVSGSSLADSGYTINITLPQEIVESASGWVFRQISSQDLVKVIKKIDFLPVTWADYTYYPGREKLKISAGNQTYVISLDPKKLASTFEKWKNLIPYMPTSDPFSVDLSDIDRIIIKQ